MYYLWAVMILSLLISLVADPKRTARAIRIAVKKFIKILPAFGAMLVLVSIVLVLVPDKVILTYLGKKNMAEGVALASFFGSITLMPGFIAYPLCGILLKRGVSYTVLSAFTTTLMMVGFVTFPVEKRYLGTRVAILRNLISLGIALVVAIVTGICFGEILR